MRRNGFLVPIALAAFSSLSCERPEARARSVLLVTIDTLRWDRLGVAGYDVQTPHLDRLAKDGAFFTQAVSAAPQTLPSHASILSGSYPYHHGARNNGIFRLGDEVETLAEVFGAAGYRTGAFVGAFVLDRRFGLAQGFDHYDDELPDEHPTHKVYYPERRAEVIAERATHWLEEDPETPFFLWVHVFDPHAPYDPPSPFDESYRDRLYDGEIAYTDRALGPLLERVEAMDDSLIVVTADHGESLGEHGESTHGLFLYDATLRVPLLMKGAGVPEGARVDEQVRTVDIAPTLLELAGLGFSGSIDGESLLPLFAGSSDSSEARSARTAYAESMIPRLSFNWSELRALRDGEAKYILAPSPELYDLTRDPEEASNLILKGIEDRALAAELAAVTARDTDFAPTASLDPETAERLETLGYFAATPSLEATDAASARGPRPDPKDRIEVYERMQALLSPELTPSEAIEGYRDILADEPENALARNRLANTLSEEERLEEAVTEYRRLVEDSEIDFTGLENLASALLLLDRVEEALEVTELAVAQAAWNPDFHVLRGEALERAERLDEARAAYDTALGLEASAHAHWRRGLVASKLGDPEGAESDFRSALGVESDHEPALASLVRLLGETGRVAEARRLVEQASGVDRDSATMLAASAEIALASGELDEAKALLERAREKDPDHTRVLALLGPIYGQEGRLAEASAVLERALERGETAPEIRRNLALVYLRQQRPDAAISELRAALTTTPNDASTWYTLGNVYFRTGRTAPAVEAFSKALELRPDFAEAAFNLGMAADAAGERDTAVPAFRRFLEISDPSDAERRREAERRLER